MRVLIPVVVTSAAVTLVRMSAAVIWGLTLAVTSAVTLPAMPGRI
jgi:hypothetical protein